MFKVFSAGVFLLTFFVAQSFANCTISGSPNNSSTNPLAGCSGVVTITGTLTINGNYNVGASGITTLVIASTGTVNFTVNANFNLPAGATIVIQSGGQLTSSTACNSLKSISIGGQSITTCNGNNVNYSFAQMMAGGGYGGNNAVDVVYNSPLCSGTPLQLTSIPTGGVTPYLFSWTGPGGFTSGVQNPVVNSPAAGYYKVVVTDVLGVTATDSVNVVINPLPSAPTGQNNSNCGPGSVIISASSAAGTTIDWYANPTGGTALLSGSTTYNTGNISGTTVYYAQTRNLTTGCVSSSRTAVTAFINPVPTATISYGASAFCSSNSNITPVITGQSGGSFSSTAGLSLNSSTGEISPSASSAGTYTVTYTFSDGTCSGSTTASVSIQLAPSATISYPGNPYCISDQNVYSVSLSGTSGGVFSSVAGLALNAGNGNITPSASSAGSYTVNYFIAGSGACPDYYATTQVGIVNSPVPDAGDDDSVCYPASYLLNGSVSDPLASTTWTTSGDGVFDNASLLAASYTPGTQDSANGSVWLILQAGAGSCLGAIDSMQLTVRSIPQTPGVISAPAYICVGNSGPVSVNPVPGATGYIWWAFSPSTILNSGTNSSVLSIAASIPTSGTYISVRAVNECGVSDSARKWVRSYISNPQFVQSTAQVCAGSSNIIYRIRVVEGADSVVWTPPSGSTMTFLNDTTASLDFSPTYTGGSLVINAYFPCLNTSTTRVISLVASRTPGNISGLSSSLCDTTITFSVAPVVDAIGYSWTVPAGVSITGPSNTNSITLQFTSFGSGTLSVRSINSCNVLSNPRSLAIKGTPATPVAISGPSTVCAQQTNVVFSIAPVDGATSYVWTVPGGSSIMSGQGSTSISVNWGNSGGNVNVKANRSCSGLSTARSKAVSVACRTTDNVRLSNDFTFYPNPTHSEFAISLQQLNAGYLNLSMLDLAGRQVYDNTLYHPAGIHSHNLSVTLPQGMYLLKLTSAESEILQKFIVE